MKRREFLSLLGATVAMPHVARAQQTPAGAAQPAASPRRILLVANTKFEADGLMAALGNEEIRNDELPTPDHQRMRWPRPKGTIIEEPRCVIQFRDPVAVIEVWCIYDLLNTDRPSSQEKEAPLKKIIDFGKRPDGVIAFGTGGFPSEQFRNGCVAVAGTVFIHDADPGGSGGWSWPDQMEKPVLSSAPASFFQAIADSPVIRDSIHWGMLPAPINPAAPPVLIISPDAVAISSVNIGSSANYAAVDREATRRAREKGATMITSVETTHGIIRKHAGQAPFISVTGIPNRMGRFEQEARRQYGQNFVASHNAGVVASWILPTFVRTLA